MEKPNQSSLKSLRAQAEAILKSRHSSTGMPLDDSESSQIIHDLQISLIELELQNLEIQEAKALEISQNKEKDYHYLFTDNPQPMWIFDLETLAFLEVNDAAIYHYGYTRDEFLSMTIKDIRPDEDVESMIHEVALNRSVHSPAKVRRHIKKNGELIHVEIIAHPMSYNGRPAKSVAINDVTKRKLTEDALIKSEEKYRLIANNSDDWIYWIAPDGSIKYVSPACERVTGYTPEEFENRPDLTHAIVFEADQEKVSHHTSISSLDDTPHNLEFRIVTKAGQIRWVNHSCNPIFDTEGKYLGRRGTNRDITERKLQEEQLFESEFRFNNLYENGPFGMVMADNQFRFKKVNPTFCALLHYSEEELVKLTFKDITHPDDLGKDLVYVKKLMNQEISVYKTEKRYIRKDGQVIWGSLTVTSTYDSNGQFLYFLGIIEDVTPRKQAEDALRERENKLSTILNLLPVGISILDENQQIVYENEALERILGITREGLERGDYRNRKYLRNDGTEKPAEEFASARAFHEKKAIYNFVTGIVKEDGQTTWTNVSAVPVDFPDWKVVLVTGDITELKQTEKALEKSKNLLTETESMGKVGGWEFNIDTLEQNWTDEVYRIHEVDLNFKQDVNKGINFYAPSSRPIIEQAVERILIFGEPFDLELEIITAKGNLRKVHTIGKADFENRRIYGFFQDITERKRVEEEVKKLNDRISTATRASQVGIWDWDIQNNALFWDDQMYALYGLKNDEFTGAFEAWVNGLHPNDREFSTEQTQMALAGEKDYDTEFRVVWPDGTIRYCKAKGEVFRNEKGEPIRMVGVNYDITERKLIEKELQESEEYLKLGYETANLGIWKNDLNTMTVEFDERARSHYGFEESVVMLSDVIARIHPDDLGRLVAQIEKATAPTGSGRYSTEYRVIHPDGSVRWLHIGVRVIYEGEGENRRSVMGFGTSLDITERKQREETLLKLEYFLSEGQKIAHVGSFEYVVETQTTNWSAEEYAIYGLDPAEPSPPYEVMLAKCIHPDDADLLNQTFGAALQSHSVYELEHRIIRPDGSIRWVFDRAKPYFDQSGKLVRYVGATLDITQRKLAEEALKKSENEFRLLAEAMPQIVWITRPDGWNIYFNQQWVDYTGLTLEESYGNGWNKPFHPDDQQRAWEAWQNAVNNNGIYSLECRLRRFDGVYKWWLIRGIPIMDSNCVIQKWFGTCTDINELKQAEFELQESKQKLDTALSSMTDAIFISDLDGNFIEFNDAFATFHKFRNKEDCAKTLAEYPEFLEVYLPTGELASIDQWAVPRALRGEVVKNAEYTLRRKDTGETWIGSYSFSPICDENSTITGSVVTARDITEQKLADEKIRQKDQEFRKLSANVPDLLFQFTRRPDGSYFVPIASEGIRNIFGCAPEDVIDDFTPIGRVIHPEDAERVIRDIEYSAEHMTYFTCEFRVQIPGREIQWIYSKSTPERLPDGSITWYGFNTDITHRKQFEKTLRESEEKFRRAFATNPDAITITRLSDGVYVSVNNGFTQAFGYTEEEIKGKTSLEINMWCNPEDRKVFVDELTTKGLVENFEARLYTKGGETIDTLVSATMLDFEGQPHILSTTKDITERKRVEVALKESEEKFRGLIESIPLPVTYVNNAGEIIFRNDRFVELIGYSQDEIPTVNEWWLVAYPDKTYREWVIRNWESALEHAKKTNSDILPKEYRIVCKDGRQRTFVVSGILIDDNLLITFVDVTDRKEAEDEIRKLNETLEQRVTDRTRQLQEANSELEAFSYSVSHDLRAPLRHINGFIDLVTENYGDLLPDKGRHYLDVIVSSSRHMGTLIDDLLQFSRTGRQEMQEADLNMNVLLQDVLFQMKHDTDSRDIVWTIADLPGIKGDQALLRMVWYNLLGNAIKFTKAKDPAKIQVGCSENENEYTFYVRDNGAGFDMRYAHKLFGVFQRLHTTKEFEGTGIGLANVRRIILKHGGRTWAEGQLNEGASFYFTLPKPKTITQ